MATDDPITSCGIDGYGGHETDSKAACLLLETAPTVYDYAINLQDVDIFIQTLRTTFPYSSKGAAGIHGPISWTQITANAHRIYAVILAHRMSKGGVTGGGDGISFRYDWRLLLAVIRASLPSREVLVGPTWAGMVQYSFGQVVATDPGYKFGFFIVKLSYSRSRRLTSIHIRGRRWQ